MIAPSAGTDCHGYLSEALKRLAGRTVLVGIGNPIRGDDGVGPALIATLDGRTEALCVDAGESPENVLGVIARHDPALVVFVDAAFLGLTPGAVRVLRDEEILDAGLTTHTISPALLMGYLRARTHAEVVLVAVQPEVVRFGTPLSPAVRAAVAALGRFFEDW